MKNKIRILVVALAIMIAIPVTVYAAYDSATDPLISKSYLEQVFKVQYDNQISALNKTITDLTAKIEALEGQQGNTPSASAVDATYKVIRVTKGQRIICSESTTVSTEIILRAGIAKAIAAYSDHSDPDAQGLSDLTDSKELLNGDYLTINHYVIVPRGDGRGVIVDSDEAYFMVRGPYTIVG